MVALVVKKLPACRRRKRCRFNPWVGKMPWNRKWHSTLVFLAEESYGQGSLAGYSPWGSQRVRHNRVTEHEKNHRSNILKHVRACLLRCFSCVRLFSTLWTVSCQTSLFMGLSSQEYWSEVPFPIPGGSSWSNDRTCISCIDKQIL